MKFIEIKDADDDEIFILNVECIVCVCTRKDSKGNPRTEITLVKCNYSSLETDEPMRSLMGRIGKLLKEK